MDKSITHIKTKAFAVRIIRFYKYLSEEKHEYVLAKQILRAGTSIGANVRESYSAQSRADFINKLHIALKECFETEYWLEILKELDCVSKEKIDEIMQECGAVRRMLVKSIKTAKENEE